MYRAWSASADGGQELATQLEAHLNEFADEIVSISYAVHGAHHVLAVYREIQTGERASAEEAVAVAEQIIDQMHN